MWVAGGQLGGRRRVSMEDNLRWKMTFDGRHPLIEENLLWKTTFDGRQPLIEQDIFCNIYYLSDFMPDYKSLMSADKGNGSSNSSDSRGNFMDIGKKLSLSSLSPYQQ